MVAALIAEYEPDFPDDELVVYRNRVFGFECVIRMRKDKVAAAAAAAKEKKGPPPFWRHGDVIDVRAALEGAADGPGASEKA